MRRLAFAAATLVLSGCITDEYRDEAGDLVIRHNDGGMIADMERRIDYLDFSDTPVRIEGWCASACTMLLGAEDVCISPGATFAFHGPTDPALLFLGPYVRSDREEWLDRLTARYPPRLREWYFEAAADQFFGPAFIRLPAEKVQALTGVPYCGDDDE